MPEYDNRLRFTLFKNNRPSNSANPAAYSGTFTDAEGREYYMDAWVQEPKNGGEKFLSGKVNPKKKASDAPREERRQPALNDDMPF